MRWRHRFSVLTILASVALIAWGGFVTSIEAGMAVPDWPASFGSFDPFKTGFHDPADPTAAWWERVPILAEHGHRLLGMLVGLLTLGLAAWTWWADRRRWMRWLGLTALALVTLQGVLGGLRVVFDSLDLALVHACVAQIFFSLLVAFTLFTSRGWMQTGALPRSSEKRRALRGWALAAATALYGQIILGALLRHPGTGLDPTLAGIHVMGAFVVAGLIAMAVVIVRRHFAGHRLLRRAAGAMAGLLAAQIALGFTAYFVLLDESGMLQPSNFQVIVNSLHLVTGALLMAAAACLAVIAWRRPTRATATSPVRRSEPAAEARRLHPAGS